MDDPPWDASSRIEGVTRLEMLEKGLSMFLLLAPLSRFLSILLSGTSGAEKNSAKISSPLPVLQGCSLRSVKLAGPFTGVEVDMRPPPSSNCVGGGPANTGECGRDELVETFLVLASDGFGAGGKGFTAEEKEDVEFVLVPPPEGSANGWEEEPVDVSMVEIFPSAP